MTGMSRAALENIQQAGVRRWSLANTGKKLREWWQNFWKLRHSLTVGMNLLPYTPRAPVQLYRINSGLLMASSEQEMLAAIAMVSEGATLRWLDLELDVNGKVISATPVSSRKGGRTWLKDPTLNVPMLTKDIQWLNTFNYHVDDVWCCEDINQIAAGPLPAGLEDIHALVLIKVFERSEIPRWHSILMISWPTARPFTSDDDFVFRGISQAASVVFTKHRLYQEEVANNARLAESNRLKTVFVHNVSHELRTPLGAVLTTSDMLLKGLAGELSPQLRKDIQEIYTYSKKLDVIIDQFLDLAKIESGKLALDLAETDIEIPIREAVQTVQHLADPKGLKIQVDIAEHLPQLPISSVQITQVFVNLLTNAIKFTEQGTIRIKAELSSENAPNIVVSVADPGKGLKPEELEIIFEPFRQVNSEIVGKKSGTGIGLPIAKGLVGLHRGRIMVESQPGTGTTFFVFLPIHRIEK